MIVFSSYFKIVKKYLPMIIMYTSIFLFFAIMASTYNTPKTTDFASTKPNVAFINRGQDTSLIKSFKTYLEQNAKIIKINDNENDLKDALFFRKVDYIIIMPQLFTTRFMANEQIMIETLKVPDSFQATYTEMLLNKFLNIAKLYVKSGMNEEELSSKVLIDLEKTADIKLNNTEENKVINNTNYYFNFSNYTLLALIILIVGMVMASFREQGIKRRNMSSPISLKKINGQLALGNLGISLGIWLIYVLFSIILYSKAMFTLNGLLMIINSLIFVICVLSIGFLVGSLVSHREANAAISNVVSLGSSFLCGAFIPQSLLGESVLSFSRIFPSYWFIKNNDLIASIKDFTFNNFRPIIINMVIILAFAFVFYLVTQMVTRWKLKHNS